MNERNEHTSDRVAALASAIMRDANGFVLNQSLRQTIEDLKTLAASCLTQARDKKDGDQ